MGKSATANKLAQIFEEGYEPTKKLTQEFSSRQSAKSVTNRTEIKSFDNDQKYIVDSIGFFDPNRANKETWITYINDILDKNNSNMNFRDNGLKVIIIPIMIPRHLRI
jgi:hypothetical protein